MDFKILGIAFFLALVTNRIVEGLAKPVKRKFPDLDTWWLIYVAWVIGGFIGWLSTINLFVEYIPNVLAGRILTAVVVGGGANLIKDIFGKRPEPLLGELVEYDPDPEGKG